MDNDAPLSSFLVIGNNMLTIIKILRNTVFVFVYAVGIYLPSNVCESTNFPRHCVDTLEVTDCSLAIDVDL